MTELVKIYLILIDFSCNKECSSVLYDEAKYVSTKIMDLNPFIVDRLLHESQYISEKPIGQFKSGLKEGGDRLIAKTLLIFQNDLFS